MQNDSSSRDLNWIYKRNTYYTYTATKCLIIRNINTDRSAYSLLSHGSNFAFDDIITLNMEARSRVVMAFGTKTSLVFQIYKLFHRRFASSNHPIKVNLTRGYKYFHEAYIHNI